MATLTLRRLFTGVLPVIVLFLLVLVSLLLLNKSTKKLSEVTSDVGGIDNMFERMVIISVIAIVVLIVLIGFSVVRLVRQYRQGVPGSRLTVRMFMMFVVLSVVPVVFVYYFSFQLLSRDIDRPSAAYIKQASKDAQRLSRISLNLRKSELLKETHEIAKALSKIKARASRRNALRLKLGEFQSKHAGSNFIVWQGDNYLTIARAGRDEKNSVPNEQMLHELGKKKPYVSIEPGGEKELHIRVAVPFPVRAPRSSASFTRSVKKRYLQAVYVVSQRLGALGGKIQVALNEYERRGFYRDLVRRSFLLVLSLVLLLSLLSAIWAAFYSTRRLVQPIKELAEGTRAVAGGNYEITVPTTTHDELGFLVQSFNEMTNKVANASKAALLGQQQVEEQRAYLHAVLSNLSSGVMTLDQNNILRVHNAQASQILGSNLTPIVDCHFSTMADEYSYLAGFIDAITPHLSGDELEWTEECVIFSNAGRQVLLVRGTTLIDDQYVHGDHIVVFDDITDLLQAQRDAAWGEVARRMAHEIKNPLTPIQLSAERLRHKYLNTMPKEDAQLLDKSTHTIVQQVQALKKMVNAFSEYARAPKLVLDSLDLNQLIREVVDLYDGDGESLECVLTLDPHVPIVKADSGRLRQLLHNLLKNAQESMQDLKTSSIEVSTDLLSDMTVKSVELVVRDYGKGFPDDDDGKLFEPYFTTKHRGTGLGLAIVKRIVEEHGGIVVADNVEPGARISIRIPISSYNNQDIQDTVVKDGV
ncbi:Nitrogen regulation protein NtrY [hydrothermal vent metagenome]|uniref:histidine kinase n=1 Tax=hydrothermal vent metagenome TaxID=652676 RepID=A0A3B0YG50_9ZZZZ